MERADMSDETMLGVPVSSVPVFRPAGRPKVAGSCTVSEVISDPDVGIAAVRIEEVLTAEAARAVHDYVVNDIVYERDEIGQEKRAFRGARTGELPTDPFLHTGTETPGVLAQEGFAFFTSNWFVTQLSEWLGVPLTVLRPTTPYRMDPGDYIHPHDDVASPEYRLSIAYNLVPAWHEGDGGETVVGKVGAVQEYEHPDYFFPLKRWSFDPSATSALKPVYNSALALVLRPDRAHAVNKIVRSSRYSMTTLYGDLS
jgi:hypothetical protein